MSSDPLSAFVATVNKLGRTPRGFDRKGRRPEVIFKAIFKGQKALVKEIWEIYTQHRDELSRKLVNNREAVVAYLLGFHLANEARATDLFVRADERHQLAKFFKDKEIRVYDIGAGSGAMSLSFARAMNVSAKFFLTDGSGPLLDAASMLASAAKLDFKTSRKVIEDLDPKQFRSLPGKSSVHVYLLGYVWNELVRNLRAKRRLMSIITSHVERQEECIVYIAEPALEQMSRPTMELRDMFCEAGFLALYPCPNSQNCPMLSRPKDWCYSEGEWDQPALVQWVDEHLGVNRSKHAATMFAFASPATGLLSDHRQVVVGRPVRDDGKERYKGFFDYLVCGDNGIEKFEPQKPKQVLERGSCYNELGSK